MSVTPGTPTNLVTQDELASALAPYLTSSNAATTYAALSGATFSGPVIATKIETRNGSNATELLAHNTYTSSTVRETGYIRWSSDVLRVGTEKGSSGGFARDLVLQTDGTTWVTLRSTGQIGFNVPPQSTVAMQVRGQGNTNTTRAIRVENSDGSAILAVRNDGSIAVNEGCVISGSSGGDTATLSASCGLRFRSTLPLTSANAEFFFRNASGSRTFTSGAGSLVTFDGGFAATSGSGQYSFLSITGPINQVGSTGITRGFFVNNTLTAAADYRAFDTTAASGFAYHSSGAAPSRLGGGLTWTPFTTAQTPAANGQLTLEMTSNTAGNLVYRGSDGVTRRMALTFS